VQFSGDAGADAPEISFGEAWKLLAPPELRADIERIGWPGTPNFGRFEPPDGPAAQRVRYAVEIWLREQIAKQRIALTVRSNGQGGAPRVVIRPAWAPELSLEPVNWRLLRNGVLLYDPRVGIGAGADAHTRAALQGALGKRDAVEDSSILCMVPTAIAGRATQPPAAESY